MATSTNTYGTSTGIENLIGDMVLSRAFTTTTFPTLLQVERQLDLTAANLNRELQAAGFAVPVSTGASDDIARQWLVGVNEMGACAKLLAMLPMTAIAPDIEDGGANRMEFFQAEYNRALKDIRDNRLVATRARGRLSAVFSGSQEDSDGNQKEPLFRRGAYDTPGTRSLTDS